MLVPIFYCIKNQPPAPLSLLFRKKSRSARCRYQLFVNSSVQLPPPKCQKCLFHVSFTGRRKLCGHESHPKWVGFFIPFNSKKLTPIDKRRPRNTDSFVAAFCGHALCLAHDSIRCKGRFKIWRVSSQHNGVHAIYSSLKNQGNFYCSFPLAWKSSAASGQVLRLLHPVKSMGYISLFLLSLKRGAEFSGLFLNPFHMISRGVLSFAYRRPFLLDEIYKYRRYIPSFRLAVCYPTTLSCPHRKFLGFFRILPPVS